MKEKARERRRILIVNRPAQKRIITAVVLVPTAGLAITTVVVAFFCRRLVDEALLSDAELPSLAPLLYSVLGFCVICAAVIAVRGLHFSHHVSGPAYRICRSLERMRTSDVAFRVKLRRGDFLDEIAAELNLLLEHLDATPASGAAEGGPQGRVAEEGPVDSVVAVAGPSFGFSEPTSSIPRSDG